MAEKKVYKQKKAPAKKNYMNTSIMNKLSDSFNSIVSERSDVSVQDIESKILPLWEELRKDLEKYTQEKLINTFESKLFSAFGKASPDTLLNDINHEIDQHRKQGDVMLSRAERDLSNLFHSIAYSEKRDFDIPWLRHTQVGEKFSNYNNDDTRYILKGFTNQAILAISRDLSEDKHDSVILFRGEMIKLLEHDFQADKESKVSVEDQRKSFVFAKLKGIKSLSSLFIPVVRESWTRPNGTRWYEKGKTRPTQEEITAQSLKSYKSTTFTSGPVWTVESVKHLISPEAVAKYEELSVIRSPKSTYLEADNSDKLDDIISEKIKAHIEDQKISVIQMNDMAFYSPVDDAIGIPAKLDFLNPVARYAVFCHELAHSTKHILSRPMSSGFGSVPYAIEEVVAESVAHLMIKDLEEELKNKHGGKLPEEWKKQFEEYYDRSTGYNQGWSKKFKFSDLYEQIKSTEKTMVKPNLLKQMMSEIMAAFQTIKDGTVNGVEITPESRKLAQIENSNNKNREIKRGNEMEPSMGQ